MPNGGVPINMVIRPADGSGIVLYAKATRLAVYSAADWERDGANAKPLGTIQGPESLVLERFLRYWLRDTGDHPLYQHEGVNVEVAL